MPSLASTGTPPRRFSDPVLHMLRSVTGSSEKCGVSGPIIHTPATQSRSLGLRQLQNTAELDDGERPRRFWVGRPARLIPRLARAERATL